MDLSKAFQKIDHFILDNTLLGRDNPPDDILFLMNCLRNQKARIVWTEQTGKYCNTDTSLQTKRDFFLDSMLFV